MRWGVEGNKGVTHSGGGGGGCKVIGGQSSQSSFCQGAHWARVPPSLLAGQRPQVPPSRMLNTVPTCSLCSGMTFIVMVTLH